MLFNSNVFLFLFLPLVLLGFAALGRRGAGAATIAWLVVASLFFYGWWNPRYVILIAVSVVANYLLGRASLRSPRRDRAPSAPRVIRSPASDGRGVARSRD